MAIASAGCGYAQGKAASAACEGLARNPGARAGIQFALILALVLIESMALYTFAIIFIKVHLVVTLRQFGQKGEASASPFCSGPDICSQ